MTRQDIYDQYDEAYFDGGKAYRTYTDSWVWSAIPEMLGYLSPESMSALDFGCAKGYLVQNLVARGIDAHGADVSSYAINLTPPSIRTRFKLLDSPTLPFPDARFHQILSFETLEHVSPEDIDLTLEEFRRVSTKGFLGSIFLEGQESGVDASHILVRSRKWWDDKFAEYGFQECPSVWQTMLSFPCIRALKASPFSYRHT